MSVRIERDEQDPLAIEVLSFKQFEKEIFDAPFTTHHYGYVRIFEQIWFERKARKAAE